MSSRQISDMHGAPRALSLRAPVAALALGLAMGLTAAPAGAMPSSNDDPPAQEAAQADPLFAEGRAALDRQDWPSAIGAFTGYVRQNPGSADAFNYLGYAQRNLGNYDEAFAAYGEALRLDPDHRGAHEYVGEAYLKTGNLAKAQEHLDRLDALCVFGCAEYTALKEAVQAYKAQQGS